MQRRFQTGFEDGNHGVPAGHLDGNETVRQGCAREIAEEIGITILPDDLRVVHVMQRKASKDERMDFFLVANSYTGEIQNCEPHKCDDLSWFPLDALPSNMVAYVRVALEHYQNGVTYSGFSY